MDLRPFGWFDVFRVGLIQASLGAIVVLTTSTLNRVMVVELALPALLPGLLVALHYAVQVLRPRMGYGSDVGGRRTPWIIGGMAVLATGGVLAALATAGMAMQPAGGIALAVLAFVLIGLGVSACGTSLLVLLAKRVPESRRAASATIVWIMMIAGFAVTATVAGGLLDPFSGARLVWVTFAVSAAACVLTLFAVAGLEGSAAETVVASESVQKQTKFGAALKEVWAEPLARRFTIFVFLSMLAYSAQDLILEPFAGAVLAYTPGQSTKLSGLQHGGVLVGMIVVALACSGSARRRAGSLRAWVVGGCLASACALLGLVLIGLGGSVWLFKPTVFILGVANGAFSIAAIGSMMAFAGTGRQSREGTRMGLWGAAQAIAFALGGIAGTGAADIARWLIQTPGLAYAVVFALEAGVFVVAAVLAARVWAPASTDVAPTDQSRMPRIAAMEGS
ncbi:MAG: BCD family MFS transporter [Burkholderiaceae bacterium]